MRGLLGLLEKCQFDMLRTVYIFCIVWLGATGLPLPSICRFQHNAEPLTIHTLASPSPGAKVGEIR